MRYLAFATLALALALVSPNSAFAKKFAEFNFRMHLSVCGRDVVPGGSGDGEGCVGNATFASGTRRVELTHNDCTGEACDELGVFSGDFSETFRITAPQVKESYEVELWISPGIFAFLNSTTYNLETHLRPVNGREEDDRHGYVSLKDPAGFNSQQVEGVRRSMLGTNGNTVKVAPYVFVSDLRFISE